MNASHWPPGAFERCWTAAARGDGAERERLLGHLRRRAILRAAHVRRKYPQAELDELIAIADAALVDIVDGQLKQSRPRRDFLQLWLEREIEQEYRRSLGEFRARKRHHRPTADPEYRESASSPATSLLKALELRDKDVISYDLDRWTETLKGLGRRERKIFLARHDFLTCAPQSTFRGIAARLGLSAERVHQLNGRALHHVRRRAFGLGLIDKKAIARIEAKRAAKRGSSVRS